MNKELRERLSKELWDLGFIKPFAIADMVDRILKEVGCYHTYERGRCPHDGCSNHRENLKEGEEKCPHGEEYACRCVLCLRELLNAYTPSSAKVGLPEKIPEKINETLALNYLTLRNKINELIDYLSAQTSPK